MKEFIYPAPEAEPTAETPEAAETNPECRGRSGSFYLIAGVLLIILLIVISAVLPLLTLFGLSETLHLLLAQLCSGGIAVLLFVTIAHMIAEENAKQ